VGNADRIIRTKAMTVVTDGLENVVTKGPVVNPVSVGVQNSPRVKNGKRRRFVKGEGIRNSNVIQEG